MERGRNKKICTILTLVGTMSLTTENQVTNAVKLDQFESGDLMEDDGYLQLEQQEAVEGSQTADNSSQRPKDSKKLQTKDSDAGDIIEQLSEEVSKQASSSPGADDFVPRDQNGSPIQATTETSSSASTSENSGVKDKEPSTTDIVSDSNTSVEHLAEIVRAANQEE